MTFTRHAEAALERALADRWHCLSDVTAARALRDAGALDSTISGSGLPLAGVPYVAKNAFDIAGIVTLAGGPYPTRPTLPTHPTIATPARHDAALVQMLSRAGAILVGAAHMDEYAYGFLGDNPHHGRVVNPAAPSCYTGGSSSGSAAAVAAGIVPFAIGTDTNGSIRVPAALCRIFGLKPTHGALSLDGCFALAPSLDHAGVLASSLDMLARVWLALAPGHAPPPLQTLWGDVRIGWASGPYRRLASDMVRHAFDALRQSAADTPDVALPDPLACLETASVITGFEAAQQHRARLATMPDRYGEAVTRRLRAAMAIPSSTYQRARATQHAVRQQVAAQFETAGVDVIVAPVAPVNSVVKGQSTCRLDGRELSVPDALGLFTRPFSLTGFPVMTVPATAAPPGMPGMGSLSTAIQVIAPPGREDRLFAFASQWQRTGF
ncbi:Biuret hydrolase [Pandoraea capi]|uniref:Biuret hydrolase n=1 Tax=Pandoraea capi TaxID=2508286 RepID=A0ABY6VSR2_9BURK|nr:amidase family protein [Pandoraea capi]VVD84221.1 Biuret hydrolase [Pandoraea capi]